VSTYSNLADKPAVSVGQEVDTGTVLGTVGNTAIAESAMPAHLHLEMTRNGEAVDPAIYLPTK
ncbi:MAG: M23 family metallopeptidase, partial [Clostridium sp.]|nr:M23 family metallopeptidase [Clostridium sp.]